MITSNASRQQCQNFYLKRSYRWHLDRHLIHAHQKESIVTIRIQSDITELINKYFYWDLVPHILYYNLT